MTTTAPTTSLILHLKMSSLVELFSLFISDPWHWVMSWSDLIPIKHMYSMLEKTFFPKWLQVLCTWMSNMPNYDEITKWYLGWKSLFSEEYRNFPPITGKYIK
jgi:tuftelin-interacting protein 11